MLNTVGYNFTYVHLLINVCTYVEGNSSSNHRGLIALLGLRRGGDSGNHMRRRRTGAKGISGFSRNDVDLCSKNSNYSKDCMWEFCDQV